MVDSALTDSFVTASRALVGLAVRSIESASVPITVSQHRVLVVLAAEGPHTVGELAELTGVNQSNASRLCDRLQRFGLVERGRAEHDARVVLVSLTRRGKSVLDSVTARRRREIARVLSHLSPTQVATLVDALNAFSDAAHERDDHEWALAGW